MDFLYLRTNDISSIEKIFSLSKKYPAFWKKITVTIGKYGFFPFSNASEQDVLESFMAWNFPSSSNSKYSTSVISNSLIYWRLALLKANGKFLITWAILNIKENNIVAVEMLKGEFMPVWNIENWVVWLFKRSQDCEHCRFYPMNRDKTLRVDRQEADRYQNICTSAPKTSPRYCWIVRNVTMPKI